MEKPPKTKEKKEEEPKLSFHFLLTSHGKEKEARKFDKAFEEADIYAPEMTGADQEDRDNIAKLSSGQINLEDFIEILEDKTKNKEYFAKGTFFYKIFETIYNSHKPILLVDMYQEQIDADKELRPDMASLISSLKQSRELFISGQFDESLEKLKKAIVILARRNIIDREKVFIKNLKEKLRDFVDNDALLKQKSSIKILVTFGSIHTTLYQDMKKEFDMAGFSREFNYMPYTYSFFHEAVRRVVFKKSLDRTILGRAVIESVMSNDIVNKLKTDDYETVFKLSRELVSRLTEPEIRSISSRVGGGESFYTVLKEGGINVPQNIEEFNELLSKQNERDIKK